MRYSFFNMHSGMAFAGPGKNLPEGFWYNSLGFRHDGKRTKTIPSKVLFSTIVDEPGELSAIGSYVNADGRAAATYAVSPTTIYLINPSSGDATIVQDELSIPEGDRWATLTHPDGFIITSLNQPLRLYRGTVAFELHNVIRGRYVDVFYEHLVVANVIHPDGQKPYRFVWSDVFDFSEWEPKVTNEADYFDITTQASSGVQGMGITGLGKLGDLLLVYTENEIWSCAYVGRPAVMQIVKVVNGIGNEFPYALALAENVHYFIGKKTIWALRPGEAPIPIGSGFVDELVNQFYESKQGRKMIFSYVDSDNNEIWWCYKPAGSATYQKALVFNYRKQIFYQANVPDVRSFGQGAEMLGSFDELTGTFNDLYMTFNDLGGAVTEPVKLYGCSSGVIRIDNPSGGINFSVDTDKPFLETGDFDFGDFQQMKEISSLAITASHPLGYGWDVFYAVRDHVHEPIVWQPAGIWTTKLRERRLSLPRTAFKLIRFKFVVRDSEV